MGNLDTKFMGYLKLSSIIENVDNLDANLGGYFKLLLIMTEVGNLYINLEGYFEISFTSPSTHALAPANILVHISINNPFIPNYKTFWFF
jgi:hypothetical protein